MGEEIQDTVSVTRQLVGEFHHLPDATPPGLLRPVFKMNFRLSTIRTVSKLPEFLLENVNHVEGLVEM